MFMPVCGMPLLLPVLDTAPRQGNRFTRRIRRPSKYTGAVLREIRAGRLGKTRDGELHCNAVERIRRIQQADRLRSKRRLRDFIVRVDERYSLVQPRGLMLMPSALMGV